MPAIGSNFFHFHYDNHALEMDFKLLTVPLLALEVKLQRKNSLCQSKGGRKRSRETKMKLLTAIPSVF